MDALPPVRLGAILLASFLPGLLARGALERRLVLAGPPSRQPVRQFSLDMGLCLFAGLLAGGVVEAVSGFPLAPGHKLLFGILAGGFFSSLDLALVRERRVILRADSLRPPDRLIPMTRTFTFVSVTALLLTAAVLGMIWTNDVVWLAGLERDPRALSEAARDVVFEVFFVIGALLGCVIRLTFLYSGNLRLLFDRQTAVLEKVSRGDLSERAPVATADEFGLIAWRTNEMIDGLGHRVRLLDALKVAEETQRRLLPAAAPELPGLELAAASRSCDETGGDYYDFIPLSDDRLAVVVGDVAGHGVGSALLMAAVRAYLRLAADQCGDLGRAVTLANAHMAADVDGSGNFATLFALEVDPAGRRLRFARAGHDPALVYDPIAGSFEELRGSGPPLGVIPDAVFELGARTVRPAGALICLGTDGIWETRCPEGAMFGKDRLRRILRENAARPLAEIVTAVFAALDAFRGDEPVEDDVTIALVRFPEVSPYPPPLRRAS